MARPNHLIELLRDPWSMSACVTVWVAVHVNGVSTVHVSGGVPFAHSNAIMPAITRRGTNLDQHRCFQITEAKTLGAMVVRIVRDQKHCRKLPKITLTVLRQLDIVDVNIPGIVGPDRKFDVFSHRRQAVFSVRGGVERLIRHAYGGHLETNV